MTSRLRSPLSATCPEVLLHLWLLDSLLVCGEAIHVRFVQHSFLHVVDVVITTYSDVSPHIVLLFHYKISVKAAIVEQDK